MKKTLALLLVAGLLGFVTVLAGVRMYDVHQEGWEWRLWPSATPPKVHYDGRDYSRGDKEAVYAGVDVSVHGHTPGGGDILDTDSPGTAVVIWVRHDDTTWMYALMGGP